MGSNYDQVDRAKDMLGDMVQSSGRSKGMLYETEEIGGAAAAQLYDQGKQLDQIQENLAKMDNDLKQSEQSITKIDSVFGGIKNWFRGRKPDTQVSKPPPPSNLENVMNDPFASSTSGTSKASSHPQQFQAVKHGVAELDQLEEHIAGNMNDMSGQLAALRNLSMGMNSELDRQNQQLSGIQTQAERVDTKIQSQNKDMNRILKK